MEFLTRYFLHYRLFYPRVSVYWIDLGQDDLDLTCLPISVRSLHFPTQMSFLRCEVEGSLLSATPSLFCPETSVFPFLSFNSLNMLEQHRYSLFFLALAAWCCGSFRVCPCTGPCVPHTYSFIHRGTDGYEALLG